MISKRIKTIASLIEKDDIVLDVGCDHGYLDIYLKENNLCKDVIASDINKNALTIAINNFQKRNLNINCYLSDGFKNIDEYFDTAVIAGMGTTTILNIIKNENTPNKLIISSNNEIPKLRMELNKLGFSIKKELIIYERKHYYVIMLVKKEKQKLKKKEILFGISNDKDYLEYLRMKNLSIIKKVPLSRKIKLYYENYILKGLTEKK